MRWYATKKIARRWRNIPVLSCHKMINMVLCRYGFGRDGRAG